MISRRRLLGTAAGAGTLVATRQLLAAAPAAAAPTAVGGPWSRASSANGWRIDPRSAAPFRIAGTTATVTLRRGAVSVILLHIARRWHYEIGPLDTGEGGGVIGYRRNREVSAPFESAYLSGTAISLHPTAYPLGGSEELWPHHRAIVQDILADCRSVVAWGGELSPAAPSHFHIAARPGSRELAQLATELAPGGEQPPGRSGRRPAGAVADPASPARRTLARRR